jgi:hypothetical protein
MWSFTLLLTLSFRLASILYRMEYSLDAASALLELTKFSPSLAVAKFALGNAASSLGKVCTCMGGSPPRCDAYVLFWQDTLAMHAYWGLLQLQPGFAPALARLRTLQCRILRYAMLPEVSA